jgi:hypothetical protein
VRRDTKEGQKSAGLKPNCRRYDRRREPQAITEAFTKSNPRLILAPYNLHACGRPGNLTISSVIAALVQCIVIPQYRPVRDNLNLYVHFGP